jgi:hypothetical protein
MKSELSWLIDLVLMDGCPQDIRKLASSRIREVEKCLSIEKVVVPRGTNTTAGVIAPANSLIATQAPSMQRIMMENPDLIPKATQSTALPPQPTTPAAAMALSQRQEMIKKAINGEKIKK